jgi:hypothetical protein
MCSAHSSPRPLKAIPGTLKSIYSSSELRVGRDRSPWTTEGCATPFVRGSSPTSGPSPFILTVLNRAPTGFMDRAKRQNFKPVP